jgi:predicted house-cleaning noncanonical NTP pyrophosphatase (MazG superfamily)
MKMRRFLFNKLARDKSIKMLEDKGAILKSSKLEDNNEYLEAITQKIVEELEEVFDSQSQEELIVELADLEEVLSAFKKLVSIDQKDIDAVRKAKADERGLFDERIFVEHADIPESAKEEIEYFSGQPDRYPEVDPKTGEFLEADEE